MQATYQVQIYKPGTGHSPLKVQVEARSPHQAKEIAQGMYPGYKAISPRKL